MNSLENVYKRSLSALPGLGPSHGYWEVRLLKTGVAVNKGTKAVISVDFSVYGERTLNNLRTDFVVVTIKAGKILTPQATTSKGAGR